MPPQQPSTFNPHDQAVGDFECRRTDARDCSGRTRRISTVWRRRVFPADGNRTSGSHVLRPSDDPHRDVAPGTWHRRQWLVFPRPVGSLALAAIEPARFAANEFTTPAKNAIRVTPAANMFWWYNMYAAVDYSMTPRPSYPADGRKVMDSYSQPGEFAG